MPDPYDELFGASPARRRPSERLRSIAERTGIDPSVAEDFRKVVGLESGDSHYDRRGRVKLSPPDPRTGERAVGAVQIKPSTARPYKLDPYDPEQNLEAGLRYFSEAGDDPVARRVHYFGGPKALQRYRRTGRIPSGQDVTGTTFQQYVKATGGQQRTRSNGTYDELFQDAPPAQAEASVNEYDALFSPEPKVPVRKRSAFVDAKAGVSGESDRVPITVPNLNQILTEAKESPQAQAGFQRRQQIRKEVSGPRFGPRGSTLAPIIERIAPRDIEADVESRRAAELNTEAERARLIPQFTDADKAEISDFVEHLKGKGTTYTGIRTGARSIGAATLYNLAGLTDVANAIQKPLTGRDSWIPDFLKRKALAGELSVEDIPPEQRGEVAEFLTQLGVGLAVITAAPGGPVTKFAGLGATEAIGRGGTARDVARETAKGATIGAVFKGAGRLPLAKELPAIGAGTYATERAFGAEDKDAALSAATNVVLAGGMKALGGRRRARQTEAKPDVAAQPETTEPVAARSGAPEAVAQRMVASEPTIAETTGLPREQVVDRQAWQHRDFGKVVESENQKQVSKGRVRVVDEAGKEHVIKRAALTGAGNQIAIPVKVPPTVDTLQGQPNLLAEAATKSAEVLPKEEGALQAQPTSSTPESPFVREGEKPQVIVPYDEYTKAKAKATGDVDAEQLLAPMQERMKTALAEGRKVEIVIPEENNKRVNIVKMVNGMAEDSKGNRWGLGGLLFKKQGGIADRIEISTAQPKGSREMFQAIDRLAGLPRADQSPRFKELRGSYDPVEFHRARLINANIEDIIKQAESKGILKKLCP